MFAYTRTSPRSPTVTGQIVTGPTNVCYCGMMNISAVPTTSSTPTHLSIAVAVATTMATRYHSNTYFLSFITIFAGAACGCQSYSFIELCLCLRRLRDHPQEASILVGLPSSSLSFISCPTSWSRFLPQLLTIPCYFQSIYFILSFFGYISFGPLVLDILWSDFGTSSRVPYSSLLDLFLVFGIEFVVYIYISFQWYLTCPLLSSPSNS